VNEAEVKLSKLLSAFCNLSNTGKPFQVIYFVTARCNARCKMCFYLDVIEQANENLKFELTLDEIKQTFISLEKVPLINLSGGEPFLREDISEVIDFIAHTNKPLVLSIPTNGSFPEKTNETFEYVCARNPNVQFDLQLSIDAIGEKHDQIRKLPGLFESALKTNRLLADFGKDQENLQIRIAITYTGFNHHDVMDLLSFIDKEMVFDRVVLCLAHGICSDEAKQVDQNQYQKVLAFAERINSKRVGQLNFASKLAQKTKKFKEKIRGQLDAEKNLGMYCNAGKKIIVISETGEVYPCESIRHTLGNLRDFEFDVSNILQKGYGGFIEKFPSETCHCDWGCGQNIAIVSNPKFGARALLSSS
jgi:MoaA/NifB/PqqE/SkfB family radical SAM enzyme